MPSPEVALPPPVVAGGVARKTPVLGPVSYNVTVSVSPLVVLSTVTVALSTGTVDVQVGIRHLNAQPVAGLNF